MKKGPVCYLYYTIKNKRKEKADNSGLDPDTFKIDFAQYQEKIVIKLSGEDEVITNSMEFDP
jgi:hypothetical protein